MKFIHMADIHFDMPMIALTGNRDLIKKRRTEQKKAFHDVIQFAKNENVDCLFIAGDLFEQKFVENSTIEYIISNFELIPEVNIFISPGNHDPYIKSSPYESFKWPDNVTIFKSDYGLISLENDIDIYGVGFEDYEMDLDVVPKINIENPDSINILITHGTLNGAAHKYHDIKQKDLEKFDYVALGHIHERKVDDCKIVYPGSLLSCGFDEPGEHGFIYGEITKEKCNIEFKKLDYKEFKRINLDISEIIDFNYAIDKLELEDDIYEIKLYGTRKLDVNELIDNLKEHNKNICKIKDFTKASYNYDLIANDEDLRGIFTRKMLDEIKNMNEEESEEAYRTIDDVYKLMS